MNRTFSTFFTGDQLKHYQKGVMNYRYRGIPCFKSPIDIALYLSLLHEAKPRAVIEVGSKFGGSALMFRDFTRMAGIDCDIVSIDIKKPDMSADGVRFLEGNVLRLDRVFKEHALDDLPRPWLVVEDSSHTAESCRAALDFFAGRLLPGEWLAMEDGVLDELGLRQKHNGGPNRAISEFFAEHPGIFAIGAEYC
ncbi:MAG: CmcI family methyltransferase, partial [Dongiaceae bacterium]